MTRVNENLRALQRLLPVVKRSPAPQCPYVAPQEAKPPVQPNQRRSEIIVKILPVRIALQMNPRQPCIWKAIVVGKLLSLPKHRNSLRSVERNGVRLKLEKPAAVALGNRIVLFVAHSCKHDQLAMIMRLDVLKRRDRHLHRVPGCIYRSRRTRKSHKIRIELMSIIIGRRHPSRNTL